MILWLSDQQLYGGHMCTIIVSRIKQFGTTVNGARFEVFPLLIPVEGKLQYLRYHFGFERQKEVDMRIQVRSNPFLTRNLVIPRSVKQGIAAFLNSYHTQQDDSFDCYAFVNSVYNMPTHKVPRMNEFWDTARVWSRVRAGDAVFFVNDDIGCFYHAAIYIGSGRYLSVLGAGGGLEVAKLKDMRRDFEAPHVLLARPKTVTA